jgi:hypothetical protein
MAPMARLQQPSSGSTDIEKVDLQHDASYQRWNIPGPLAPQFTSVTVLATPDRHHHASCSKPVQMQHTRNAPFTATTPHSVYLCTQLKRECNTTFIMTPTYAQDTSIAPSAPSTNR